MFSTNQIPRYYLTELLFSIIYKKSENHEKFVENVDFIAQFHFHDPDPKHNHLSYNLSQLVPLFRSRPSIGRTTRRAWASAALSVLRTDGKLNDSCSAA